MSETQYEQPEGRIPRLTRADAGSAAAEAGVPDYVADLSVFQVLLRHGELASRINDLLAQLLFHGRLDARLRELVIMRIGWRTGSVYEWTQHWRIAPQFGVDEADLVRVRDWRDHAAFGPAERAVLAATDEAIGGGAVTEETWRECEVHVPGTEARLELVAAIGLWQMISVLLQTLEIPLEDGLAPWPPDGRVPD